MVFRELRDEVQVVKIPDQPILLSIELLDCAFKTHGACITQAGVWRLADGERLLLHAFAISLLRH